jgi:hypothetical protein
LVVISQPKLIDVGGREINLDLNSNKVGNLNDFPLPPVSDSWKDPTSQIFIGISHYRDSRCATTVNNLLSKAKYPERIHIGIIQQTHTESDTFDCIKNYCDIYGGQSCPLKENLKIIEVKTV